MVPMLLRITRVHQASNQSRDPWREKGNGGAEKSLDNNQADVHSSNSAYRPRENV